MGFKVQITTFKRTFLNRFIKICLWGWVAVDVNRVCQITFFNAGQPYPLESFLTNRVTVNDTREKVCAKYFRYHLHLQYMLI